MRDVNKNNSIFEKATKKTTQKTLASCLGTPTLYTIYFYTAFLTPYFANETLSYRATCLTTMLYLDIVPKNKACSFLET